jgi:hypothetical protein
MPWAIKYERYRTLIVFLSPRKMKCIEEILLHNSGDQVDHIIFDLEAFKQQLYVYDSDDKKLEFHSFTSPRDPSEYLIKIKFPSEKLLKTDDYRTIALHYYIEVPTDSNYKAGYSIPLDIADSTYIHFDKPKEFHVNLNFFKGDWHRNYTYLTNNDDQLKIKETEFKVQIIGKKRDDIKELAIIIIPELREDQKNWFNLGIAIGELSAISILFELIEIFHTGDKFLNFIPAIIPLAASAIASLIIIKGWIFVKDMDSILREVDTTENFPFHINNFYIPFHIPFEGEFTYDRVYIALILIIMIEIVTTIILFIHNAIG